MSRDLSLLSRPFLPLDIRPLKRGTKPEPLDEGNAILEWGSAGSDVFQLQASNQNEIKNEDSTEVERTYDIVRVKNPDDPEQNLDVEVATEFALRTKISESRFKVRYTPQEASENVEIIARNQKRTTE